MAKQVLVARRLLGVGVSPTVVFLGLTSMFTDISTEMVNAVLPLYLTLRLGFSPLHFGLFDGLYHGISALVRIGGGLVADRTRRYKEVAGAGYGLSAACKLGLWSAGSAWVPTVGFLFLDRVGKGVRTPPRDALISLSTPAAGLAGAFGVHRALDTAGALLGPILAFGLLALIPAAYDVIFVFSFCLAVIGLGILLFFVTNAGGGAAGDSAGRTVSLRDAAGLLRGARFRGVVLAGIVLSLATVSDGFVYLTFLRGSQLDPTYFPLLYVGTALVYLLLAVPVGRLADRVGRPGVFLAGYALLLGVYAVLLRSGHGPVELTVSLLLLGAYYAATDGVIMAIASAALPHALLTSGLALLTTATALSRLLASVVYGALWTWSGPAWTLVLFLGGLLTAIAIASAALLRPVGMGRT